MICILNIKPRPAVAPEPQAGFSSDSPARAAVAVLLWLGIAFCSVFFGIRSATAARPDAAENLAPKAKVSATSQYSDQYLARFAVDGNVPEALCKEDSHKAWCVQGQRSGRRADFTLLWPAPVEVAEVVYFGRTAQILDECFKDYEVLADDRGEPIARGRLKRMHGPQRIKLPKTRLSKLTLRFLNSHTDRYNPGASEIAVYRTSPTDGQLAEFLPPPGILKGKLQAGELGFNELLVIRRHPLRLSHVYVYHAEGFQPGGGLYVYSPSADGGRELRELVASPEGMIIDCDLSFDGRQVVFSWKRGGGRMLRPNQMLEEVDRTVSQNNYQVYRVNIDGTGLVQLTTGQHNNLNACWLPDGGIAFLSDRKPAYAYCFVTTSPVLYRMDGDGSNQRRLSSNYLMDFTPAVLGDGRIIYTRWEYVDKAACPIQSLWSINPDGTGLSGYYGNRVIAPGTFMEAHAIAQTNKILCLATNHNGDCRGGVCIIDRTRGANAKQAVRNVTPEVDIYRVGGVFGNGLSGPYETPYPVDEEYYLVSRSGTLELRNYGGGEKAVLLRPGDGMGFYSPRPVRPRKRPPVIPSMLPPKEDAQPWATIHMQDVYYGLEPHVKRGEIKQICVVQEIEKSTFTPLVHQVPTGKGYAANTAFGYQFPLVSCGATYAPKKVWGFADVAEDGSACFRVPAELPIYFMAIDRHGRAVQRMRTFTHLMPGEVQGCVGCHAERSDAAGRRHAAPAFLGRTPQELRPPEWGLAGFSYADVVQPVLDRYCIECHNARAAAGGVDLSGDKTDFFNVSYDVLARKGTLGQWRPEVHGVKVSSRQEGRSPYTSWISTINGSEYNVLEIRPKAWGSPASPLADLILAGHCDEDGKPRFEMDPAARRRVMTWIDLNVPYYPTSASNHRGRMGCRRMLPPELAGVLRNVAARRCASCHAQGIPRKFYTRVLKPQDNNFLLAPLAKSAGGTQACGKPIFLSKDDPDYQAILKTFEPIRQLLKLRPRMDMPAADHACSVPPN